MSQVVQEPQYFRPPSEADSLLVQVMKGCPHNKCRFCGIFRDIPFRIIALRKVLEQLDADAEEFGPELLDKVTSIYLEGGDPLALGAEHLLAIMRHAWSRFPALQRLACYATARSVLRKTPDELHQLAQAGLQRVYVGLESGVDEILLANNKGCSRSDLILAGKKLLEAGIENDVSMMLGIGGAELSERHARETAEVINLIHPAGVRIATFIPQYSTELGQDCLDGNFTLMGPHAVIRELRLLIESIDIPVHILCSHWSNFIQFEAILPLGKQKLLRIIDEALYLDESQFRLVGITSTKL
ncbi:MAG: radical SAM protein [Deltaproteobacteria bacterium]|jgi:radical SAM superfamily enzyme YgiQ (UPF0313 family)|nr:radical SAM protein [Deltaproteobacteria bacterium]